MNMPKKTRLGRRLRALFDTIPDGTDQLVDLCCDHGALGRAALEAGRAQRVLFNDIHPDIMAALEDRLIRYGADSYELSVGPAQTLILPKAEKGVAILAGVGDEQTIAILDALFQQPSARHYRFVVSPATKTAYVRNYLRHQPIVTLSDRIVDDNGRCYELITIALADTANQSQSQLQPSLVGQGWQPEQPIHERHLRKLLAFYQAQQHRQPSNLVENICTEYETLLASTDRNGG
ncbi:tRNA (adenine(22)-N(1))-methyltransferase TrmK [Reinekea blandensis]|uniref:SAM-dependent methyltransferase n=1 Tax=Reinekea blandensis MED297 TaxID=314283 RepID=A4BE32_9GAMM|nr:tRNA (adenine(22)-N(1))-methyltransferase TrmK [Reinekea blandensis]EAR09510.1 hypothetical protein MED297_12302 [Reinekea blandensis MED297]